MKFAYFGYRTWAEDILRNVREKNPHVDSFTPFDRSEYRKEGRGPIGHPRDHATIDVRSKREIEQQSSPRVWHPRLEDLPLKDYGALLFYGWSWKVPKKIVDSMPCVCLHPSPLPKYRGGSPIQHQMINGETTSAVTLFQMDQGMDTGPIYYQQEFPMGHSLEDVFKNIIGAGTTLTEKLLEDFRAGKARAIPQDESKATTYARRKPEESEITQEMLRTMTAEQLRRFIGALDSPYPNAYVLVGKEKVYVRPGKEK